MNPPLPAWETIITYAALAAGIMLPRFVPFLLFSRRERLPAAIIHLGATLPHAAMALLLVYCVRDIAPAAYPYGLPEAIGIVFTAAIHLWKNNALASIGGGTVFYMFLVQVLF